MIYKITKICECGFEYRWETSYKPPSSFKCQRCGKKVSIDVEEDVSDKKPPKKEKKIKRR